VPDETDSVDGFNDTVLNSAVIYERIRGDDSVFGHRMIAEEPVVKVKLSL
jgi:hypothetical protein